MSTELKATVVRVTFFNEENGYSVLRVQPEEDVELPENALDAEGQITITGNFPELAPGEFVTLTGAWQTHAKFGQQFNATNLQHARPTSLWGLERYLGSGLLKGIGPATAKKIIATFGDETLDIIDNHPLRLSEVPDIGKKRSKQIIEAWDEHKQARTIMLALHGFGMSTNLATKILREYGDEAVQIVEADPYRLAKDVYGVGFKKADEIAQTLGLPADHPTRLEAGLIHQLNESVGNGHVYLPENELMQEAAELLNSPHEELRLALERLAAEGQVELAETNEQAVVYPIQLFRAEAGLADLLSNLVGADSSMSTSLPSLSLLDIDAQLSQEQLSAVEIAFKNPVSILTGGPGTGKTTTMRALIAALESSKLRFALCSPTGRAAKRLSQTADRPASTIHRLLGYSPQEGFKHNAEQPLEIDFLVVDETSMLDLPLAYALFKALKAGTHCLLVGDVDQLPSVGAGDVLRDLIKSESFPLTRLSVIFRQAKDSQIIANSHRINQGELPEFPKEGTDFFLFPAEDGEGAIEWVRDVVQERIPARFQLDSLRDIQVMAPLYRGAAGVDAINLALQEALNPASAIKAERQMFGSIYRAGDKLMQIRNDYEKNVYNGDIGLLREISNENHALTLEIDGRSIDYDWSEGDQLTHAFAITVHKSQGSEFPAVVLPVLTQHYIMLQRNLLYTAITRAKELCVLVGNKRAIAIAVKNNQVAQRWSGLANRVKDLLVA
jgi:exodeoxyribonuclease V alpha subunit